MTALTFNDRAADAARLILEDTALAHHYQLHVTVYGADESTVLVHYDDNWHGWSSGEQVLVDLLGSLSTRGYQNTVTELLRLDMATRETVWLAIGTALGLPVSVLGRAS